MSPKFPPREAVSRRAKLAAVDSFSFFAAAKKNAVAAGAFPLYRKDDVIELQPEHRLPRLLYVLYSRVLWHWEALSLEI
jgi:hypothetical protein